MHVGILGAGHIGATLARLLTRAGHRVTVSNSRGPESLRGLVSELGPLAEASTAEEAAASGDLVIEAVPFGRERELPARALRGKVLVSASNYYPNRDGEMDLGGRAHTEYVAGLLPGVRVVKAFNTIYWEHLRDQGDPALPLDLRRAIPIAGDDLEGIEMVEALVEELGFAPVRTGTLRASRVQEPGAAIYNQRLTASEVRARLA
jgi:8-hydroxy-5-deazaflavin:NADPH oxidoreductase